MVGGTEAPGDEAVVALVARRVRCSGESLTLLCSGTLIAPDVVLTAAHCLDVFGPEGAYEVFLGARLLPETRTEGRFVRVAARCGTRTMSGRPTPMTWPCCVWRPRWRCPPRGFPARARTC
ncbi:trypsin-like serine protease [Cystobacter fuscus]